MGKASARDYSGRKVQEFIFGCVAFEMTVRWSATDFLLTKSKLITLKEHEFPEGRLLFCSLLISRALDNT